MAASPVVRLLNWRAIWAFLRKQPASYWLVCAYVFIEYVRPQQIYPVIEGLPFGMATIGLCGIAYIMEGAPLRKLNVADVLLGVYTAIVLISSITAFSPSFAFANLEVYISWIVVYALISNIVTTEKRFFVFMIAYILYSLKMSQHGFRSWAGNGFGFSSWGVTCAPAWFHNSGECGIQMSMFLPISLFFALAFWPYLGRLGKAFWGFVPVTAVGTVVASSSRGALLAIGAVGAWLVLRSRHRVRAGIVAVVLGIVVFMVTPAEQKARLSAMGDDGTSVSRLVYWKHAREIIKDHPLLGIGYANWFPYYRTYYNPRGELVHNVFYQAATELGFPGLFAFFGMIGATFYLNRKTRRIARRMGSQGRFLSHMATGLDGALVGFMVSGFFVTVLYYPFFWINLAMTSALYTSAISAARAQASTALAGETGDPRNGTIAPLNQYA